MPVPLPFFAADGHAGRAAEVPAISAAERLDWLRLIRTENVGPVTFRELLRRFPTVAEALDRLPELSRRGGRSKPLKPLSRAAAEREYDRLVDLGGHLLTWADPDYPAALKATDGAPPVLSAIGHTHLLRRPAVGIVGARNGSLNGMRLAERFAAAFGEAGFTVVSGLAKGIDTAAHRGSLATGTVACLAGGVDVVYPQENSDLHRTVGETGCLLSEVALGQAPTARHFPRRNRIISGLSLGVLVVEATERSGSLITARLANEQGREVFAIPGSPLDPRSAGPNRLIRDGAQLVDRPEQAIDTLSSLIDRPISEPPGGGFDGPTRAPDLSDAEIAGARAAVLEALSATPTPVDDLLRHCQYPQPVIQAALLDLELAGRVRRDFGNRAVLI